MAGRYKQKVKDESRDVVIEQKKKNECRCKLLSESLGVKQKLHKPARIKNGENAGEMDGETLQGDKVWATIISP